MLQVTREIVNKEQLEVTSTLVNKFGALIVEFGYHEFKICYKLATGVDM